MKQFSYILCSMVSGPARWPGLFNLFCLIAGSCLCVRYLRGHAAAETVALILLGAVAAAPVAMLCIVISHKAAILMLDDQLHKVAEKAKEASEEMFQQRLTKFLEDCIEEEGDTPVWKSGNKR